MRDIIRDHHHRINTNRTTIKLTVDQWRSNQPVKRNRTWIVYRSYGRFILVLNAYFWKKNRQQMSLSLCSPFYWWLLCVDHPITCFSVDWLVKSLILINIDRCILPCPVTGKIKNIKICRQYNIYVTGEMDISVGSVPPDPNLTGRMDPGMNTNI